MSDRGVHLLVPYLAIALIGYGLAGVIGAGVGLLALFVFLALATDWYVG